MHAPLRSSVLLAALAAPACYEPTTVDGATGGTGSSSGGTDGATASATSPTASQTTPTTDGDTSSSTDAPDTSGSTEGSADTTATGGSSTTGDDPGVTICEHGAGGLGMCGTAFDGTPAYGMVACDPTVKDFSIFYEDVFTIDLLAGDCLYVRVDNIGRAGATGVAAADIAMQIRSPSGQFGFHDDDVACTDPTWTGGGACPQAQLTADVDGTYEIGVTQVSGSGCINPAPYTVFAATNGVDSTPGAPAIEDALVDCAG